MAGFEIKNVVYLTLIDNNEQNSKRRQIDKIRIIEILPNSNVFKVYNLKNKTHSPMSFDVIYKNINFGILHVTNASFFKQFVKGGTTKKASKAAIRPDTPVDNVIHVCNMIKEQQGNGYGMTLAQLTSECLSLVMSGYGDKRVFISRDDEGNGYHGLVYSFETDNTKIQQLDDMGDVPHDGSAIILG